MMSIGQRIKECRELLKMTQESLANKIGTTKQTIYKYENDIITNIPPDKVELLAKALAISPAYLMGWIDNDAEKGGGMKDYKEFKSIHVDLEKGIYLLNGEPMKYVTELNLMLDGERWSLRINKYEWFEEGSRRTPSSIARAIRDTGASIRGQE